MGRSRNNRCLHMKECNVILSMRSTSRRVREPNQVFFMRMKHRAIHPPVSSSISPLSISA
jgi:hypothetical protein